MNFLTSGFAAKWAFHLSSSEWDDNADWPVVI